MPYSPLNLHYYYVTEMTFSVNKNFQGGGVIEFDNDALRVVSELQRSQHPESEPEWIVTLRVLQLAADNLPYSFSIEVKGHFSVDSQLPDEKKDRFLKMNGASILYGTVREMVRSISSMGPFMPVTLPTRSFSLKKPETECPPQDNAESTPAAEESDQ